MAQKDKDKRMIPPYVPFRTLITFLDSLRAAVPPQIDRSLMKSFSGGSQSEIVVALKYLGLMEPETSKTTDKLKEFVESEGADRQRVLKSLLVANYRFLFEEDFDLENATAQQLRARFGKTGATGDTLEKCIRFFMKAASTAGLQLSPYFKKVYESKPANAKARRKVTANRELPPEPIQPEQKEETKPTEPRLDSTLLDKFLEKLPSFDPNWPPEAQTTWLNAYKELMAELKKPS